MTPISRRRFLTISAAAIAAGGTARAAPLHQWRGVALGAEASITLAHPEADRIIGTALAEIQRLEGVFSLYRADSALSRLNRSGELKAPPFELLECLGLCSTLHAATGGRFDPTVQPLWALYAERFATGTAPGKAEIEAVRSLVGFTGVDFDAQRVRLARAGMALTLNGIAQGYIADRVADRMRAEGLTDILVNTGEVHAVGTAPGGAGTGWPVSLRAGDRILHDAVRLRDRALASSAPLGTVFDAAGRTGHILDPRTGEPAAARWQLVSVTAPRAAVADGLSTAGCLMTRKDLHQAVSRFPEARVEYLG